MDNQPKYEQKDMTGTIWMDLKTKDGINGQYEVYTGDALIGGKEMYVNAYPRTTKTGKQLLSLTFKPKLPKAEAPRNEFASEPMPVMNGLAQFAEEKPQAEEIPLESIPF
jgi:hypothetical protein